MAINSQRISLIEGARARRMALPRYLRIDGSRYLLGLVLILSLMSLIVLVQTGVVATKGYALAGLEAEKVTLLRERSLLQERQARAQSLDRIRRRAEQLGMQPVTADQVRYVDLMIKPANVPLAPELSGATMEERQP
ncbi:hypothetical protein [Candidatus Chloroploca sp. Khr17]|uniref:hypothetical protein n=1 Tax=Candidatus Chloroploca sp. Khr17 TaxID=2496869 RepID=UPI00196B2751|nr:hypothetical protein [Candidatus Chloroploca sp. Khr17]